MRREVILLTLLGACFDPPPPVEGPYVESHVELKIYPADPPPSLDMLFVVDNTAAMAPYAARRPELAAVTASTVETLGHGFVDLQIAVTTNGGALSPVLADRVDWLGAHTSSFQGSLESNLAALLDVGTSAPGPAQPLAAMRTALDSTGFSRAFAPLVVVTVAATDDASPALDYVAFLKSLKSDPSNVLALGLYTLPSPNLDAFHQSFPNRESIVSIDTASYADAFTLLTQVQRDAGGVPCFESNLFDLDPDAPGLQPDCDVSAWNDGVELARVPQCQGTSAPAGSCWEIGSDPADCLTLDHLTFKMRGAWALFHPEIHLQCVTLP